jgi:hypothetical protein
MTWQPPSGNNGWRKTAEQAANRFTYIIRTTLQIVAGGVIRYAKTAWDDTRAGFWLGVDSAGVPRFHIGNTSKALLWDGSDLVVKGDLETPTVTIDDNGLAILAGDDTPNWLRFVDAAGTGVMHLSVSGAPAAPWAALAVARPANAHTGYLDLDLDGSLGENVRVRLVTTYGTTGSARIQLQIGNQTVLELANLTIDAKLRKITNLGDATADTDALNRQTADARYPLKSAGYTGTFRTDEINTVTVADGIITNVA